MLFLFLTNVKYISSSVIDGLTFCGIKLIPSLFPFMVLSSIMLYCIRFDGNFKLSKHILDNCKIYTNEIIIGCICGFVIGAKGICKKYKQHYGENDFNRAIFLSSNAGVGFVIGCVGCSIFNDIFYGIYLYVMQILSGYVLFKISYKATKNIDDFDCDFIDKNLIDATVISIKNSTDTIITICGFSVFFSIVLDLLIKLFNVKNANILSLITVFLDFSKGIFSVVKISNFDLLTFISGFCIGFGGLSVFIQICSICEGYPFNKTKFFILKFSQGIILGILSILYSKIFYYL